MNWSTKLTKVALVHVAVVVASPAIAAVLFLCLTLDLGSSMHLGGLLAFGFGVLFAYLFYGARTLLLVLIASPVFWGLAKLKSRAAAFVLAVAAGAALGWLFGQLLVEGEDKTIVTSASLAASITGALAAPALEFAWRA